MGFVTGIALLCLFFGASENSKDRVRTVVLKIGEVQESAIGEEKCSELKSATLGNKIIAVQDGEMGCRLLASQEGEIYSRFGKIVVLPESAHDEYRRLCETFSFLEKMRVTPKRLPGGDWLWSVYGKIPNRSCLEEFQARKKESQSHLHDEVELDSDYLERLNQEVDRLNSSLAKKGSRLSGEVVGKGIRLTGAGKAVEIQNVFKTFSDIHPIVVNTSRSVEHIPQSVRLKIQLVEMLRRKASEVGLDPGLAVSAETNFRLGSFGRDEIWTDGRFENVLHSLQSSGDARVGMMETMPCRNGETVLFESGGEMPIRSNTRFSSRVDYKDYGLRLRLECRIRSDVDLNIEFRLSEPLGVSEGVPAFNRKKYSNHLRIPMGAATVLFSTKAEFNLAGKSGFPVLGSIPFLGRIFRSESERADVLESYLVLSAEEMK